MWNYIYTDEFYHHGIKGQKWGVRRFQNEDGSLTPAGQKRQAREQKKADKKEFKKDVKMYGRLAGTRTKVYDDDTGLLVGEFDNASVFANDMRSRKGQDYVDKVKKKAAKKAIGSTIGTIGIVAAATAGAAFVASRYN